MSCATNARNEVPVQTVTMERNEIILRAGDIATAINVEALTQVGLIQDAWNWWITLRAILFTIALMVVLGGTLYRLRPSTILNVHEYALLDRFGDSLAVWLPSS